MKKTIAIIAIIAGLVSPSVAALTSWGLDKDSYTSDFMMGTVVVSVIFPESNGAIDPNLETWSDDRKSQVLSQIMAGLDWWTHQNPRSPLSFTFVTESVETKYEPINRPYYDEALWIPDVMGRLGYSGSRFTSTRNYINDLRKKYHTDWGYVIFVVDSLNDSNGKFTDGMFAYSYLGGPFTVMTYDNNGYGISNMSVVVAHETGHIFHALDEYAGASSPNDYSSGYFPTINGNHVNSPGATTPNSIMRGGINWGLDHWVREMIGWRDADNNGRDDILDQAPTTTLSQHAGTSGSALAFDGRAAIAILPRQGNANGFGLSVDTVSKVEYKLSGGDWLAAIPADGAFDSADENFAISVPASEASSQNVTAQDVQVRVTTVFATHAGQGVTTSASTSSGALASAHAFPNPYKPNSGLSHTDVTFSNLTPGAKVQIFSVAGDPVFQKDVDTNATTLQWNGTNDGGQTVASGVYFYLITDEAGNKKDGKIAVIR